MYSSTKSPLTVTSPFLVKAGIMYFFVVLLLCFVRNEYSKYLVYVKDKRHIYLFP